MAKGEEARMDSQILGWADVVMDTGEVAVLVAILWLFLRLDRKYHC